MKAYKLTDQNHRTRNNTLFEIGKPVTAAGNGEILCSDGYIHFYCTPLIGLFMNPINGNFSNLILWECEGEGEMIHGPLKSGCKTLTVTKIVEAPTISTINIIAFGILCSLEVYKETKYTTWANNWLSGKDRSLDAAYNAAAYNAAAAARTAAAYNAAAAARTAARISKQINFEQLAQKSLTYL